jgi:sugar lactone lactonase YvrE
MGRPSRRLRALAVVSAVVRLACAADAADRAEITFTDGRIFPESLASTKDGTVYIGSLGLDSIYRATPNSARAEPWIRPKQNGLQSVLGVYADEPADTLWVCSSATGGRDGAVVAGETAIKAFALKDASFKSSYPFPGSGVCNDIAVAPDGTVYATDTTGARVLRLKKGAAALDVWAADTSLLGTADGIALLAGGAVYVNSFSRGTLVRVPVRADGSAGTIVKLKTSRPLQNPDGMRAVGRRTMLLVEGAGRLDEVTIDGDEAKITVLQDGLTGPTAVTLAGGMAYVAEGRLSYRNDPGMRDRDPGPFRAVGVRYKAPF